MKKMCCLVLALAMIISLLAACGNSATTESASSDSVVSVSQAEASEETKDESDESAQTPEAAASAEEGEATGAEPKGDVPTDSVSYPLEGDDLNLSMWVSVFIGSPYETHPVFVEAEKQTGVHINFIETNPGAERDDFQLTIAAGDYPDMFRGLNNFYTGGASAAVEDEIIFDLAPYISEYAPDYWALLNLPQYDDARKDVYDDNGQMGCMFQLSSNPNYTSQSVMFRQDWLNELDMDVPETIQENYAYMKATMEQFGATNACYMNDEFQYSELANAYGVAGYSMSKVGSSGSHFYQVDGEARSSFNQEGFRKYLTTLNQWYNEGIINRDFMSNQSGTMTEYLYAATNDCGRYNRVMAGQIPTLYETAAENGIDTYELVPGKAMVEEKGGFQHFAESTTFGANFCVTTACGDLELAMAWLNYFSTEDGILLCNYGVEGSSWERDADGNPAYTDYYTDNPDYPISQVEEALAMPQMPTQKIVDRMDYLYDDVARAAIELWSDRSHSDSAYNLPAGMTFNAEEKDIITGNLSDLETYASECVPKFIMGEMDIETQWDEFVGNVEAMGLQNVLDAYQDCLDRYYAR